MALYGFKHANSHELATYSLLNKYSLFTNFEGPFSDLVAYLLIVNIEKNYPSAAVVKNILIY